MLAVLVDYNCFAWNPTRGAPVSAQEKIRKEKRGASRIASPSCPGTCVRAEARVAPSV